MDSVPRLLGIALAGLVLAASGGSAFAGAMAPGNTEAIASLPPSSQDLLPLTDDKASFAAQPEPDRQSGYVDFFSVRPDVKSDDFTSLLGNGMSGGGLKLHFNW